MADDARRGHAEALKPTKRQEQHRGRPGVHHKRVFATSMLATVVMGP